MLDQSALKIICFCTATNNGHNLVCPAIPVAIAHIIVDNPVSVLVTCARNVLALTLFNATIHSLLAITSQSDVCMAVVYSHVYNEV